MKFIIAIILSFPLIGSTQDYVRVIHGSILWMVKSDGTDSMQMPIGDKSGYSIIGHYHSISKITGLQAALDSKGTSSFSGVYSDLTGKPSLFDGIYASLTSKPTLFDGVFSSLTSKPTTISGYGITDTKGYTLSVQALTSSPTDAQTIYFGGLPRAPTATAATSKIYIRKAGTIKIAEIYCQSGTAGTNEAWVISIRLNNTTDTQIASLSVNTGERIWSNTSLSIAVAIGDYIEIKSVNPTWATNPLTTIFGGYVYIE